MGRYLWTISKYFLRLPYAGIRFNVYIYIVLRLWYPGQMVQGVRTKKCEMAADSRFGLVNTFKYKYNTNNCNKNQISEHIDFNDFTCFILNKVFQLHFVIYQVEKKYRKFKKNFCFQINNDEFL